ncbi:hypothetical protein PSPO01_11302 [Paraphaeosphaeria sporulosa]
MSSSVLAIAWTCCLASITTHPTASTSTAPAQQVPRDHAGTTPPRDAIALSSTSHTGKTTQRPSSQRIKWQELQL